MISILSAGVIGVLISLSTQKVKRTAA